MRFLLFFFLLILSFAPANAAYDSANAAKETNLEILRVTPDGDDVPAGKQIVIEFNRPVVPIGRMERTAAEIPITIAPALQCEWRWINTSSLACNLPDKAPLQEATRYKMEIKPGIKTEDGVTITNIYKHEFVTYRPLLNYTEFYQWKSPSDMVIRVIFNQPVDKESVADHVFLSVGDEAKRVNLSVRPDPRDQEQPQFIRVPGENYFMFFKKTAPKKSDDDLHVTSGREARRIWLVEPKHELPLDTHVIMQVEPGVISAVGPEPGISKESAVAFDTYPKFEFLGINCEDNNGTAISFYADAPPVGKCNPMRPVNLSFSAPVTRSDVGHMLKFQPRIGGWDPYAATEDAGDDEGTSEESADSSAAPEAEEEAIGYEYRQPHTKGKTYEIWLPPGLKAAQEYQVKSNGDDLNIFERFWHWLVSLFSHSKPIDAQDIFGRTLDTAIASKFVTDHRNPNYVLDYSEAVLEKGVDSEVPLYVNNINSYRFDYDRLSNKGVRQENQVYHKTVANVKDIQYAVPLGVREMLQGKTGAIVGYLTTDPLVKNTTPQQLFAEVTPYQVHVKLGHFNSIAWVTEFASGAPVAGAKVSIYKDLLGKLQNADTKIQSVTDEQGIAVLPGTDKLDPDLAITRSYNRDTTAYFVWVQKDEDSALLPLTYQFIIDSYRSSGSESVYPTNRERYGHMRAWGTTAQGIYRAGDTIQYKIFVRDQNNNTFIPAPTKNYELKIIDPTGKVVEDVEDVKLSAFGGINGEFTVPKEGAVGWYQFKLLADFAEKSVYDEDVTESADMGADGRTNEETSQDQDAEKQKTFLPMRVLISDFTPASFHVTNQLNGDLFRSGQDVNVTTHAALHSGGAYTDAAARITATLDSASFIAKNPAVKNFQFDSYQDETPSQQLFQKVDKINDKGELALSFPTGEPKIVYGNLTVESAVADDRGKYISGQSRAEYLGVDRLVGLHANEWMYTVNKPAEIQYTVVDEHGNPVKGTDVNITIEHETSQAARVKGAGNAYLTEYHKIWEPAGNCQGASDVVPSTCKFTPGKAGSYRATAKIKDTKGKDHATTLSTYATGSDFVVWDDENDSSLTVIPQSTSYKVGDTARFLVKNPYPGAKALITIERYGVIDHYVQSFDTSTPVVEFKVKPDYLPGFYLSVVVFSPRVEKPLGEGQVDLGKPTFRIGYVTVPVKDPYKEMVITSQTDREVYKPRDKVTVKIHAEPRVKDKKEPIELTVAVLDESVFDLIAGGKSYFDPYAGFYKLESLDLRNYSLLTRLIGRQKFEKKGANPGGDGGADLKMRSLFKFVSYWNAQLKTDKDGNATATFEAPDNLTGWRVLAIATTPSDRFGLGDANFKVNRPTEVRPVLPNQVMEGDSFDAGFSVMNRTDKPRTLNVKIHAEGNLDAKTAADFTKTVKLDPYKRMTVLMPVKASAVEQKSDVKTGNLKFTVVAGDQTDRDGLVQNLTVNKRRSFDVAANYGTTTQDKVEEPVLFPKGILPDVGSVSVIASPTVIGNITGAFTYMRDYPYICWEQKLSKGVMASHYKNLKAYLPDWLKWASAETLPQATLDQAASFQAPNGGMTYFTAQDKYVDPYLSAYTALGFNWLRSSGYKIPEAVESKLQDYLSNMLKNDVVPDFYNEGMTSTVRAVALDALAEQGKADLADLERYHPHVQKMSLFGKAYYLKAALAIKGGDKYAPEVAKMILAMSNETGGKFVFNESWDDSYSRILASPMRENCVVLDAFVAYGERPGGDKLVGDVPFKLMRSITQSRKNRDYWENTQENMFCMNALIDFARVYEKDKPNFTVNASMDGQSFGQAEFSDVRNPAAQLVRPIKENDPGRKATVSIERNGVGRLYYATRLAYALPVEMSKPANAGIEVHREYSVEREGKWQLLESPAKIKRGELVRVDLYLSIPAARNFVVVDDPLPGGLEAINRDLATTSKVDAKKGEFAAAGGSFWFKFSDWIDFGVSRWDFYHQEIRNDSVRFYSDYLPPGNYHLSYAAQAIATGTFSALPTMAQEMYDPDVYGKTAATNLKVDEQATSPQPEAKP